MSTLFVIITLLLLLYIYLGYPALACLMAHLFPQAHRFDTEYTPSVTLIISAYNEEKVIAEKLENSLRLDYPAEKLSIIVVSDCSSDHTDELVSSYRDKGVRLIRPSTRRGKTAGLNMAMAATTSDMVVFSDANAMYDPQAVRNLARHFSDPAIGYVVGHARYKEEAKTAAGKSENSYWGFETRLKGWESKFSSVVGGDGALYAIRRELYEPLQDSDINDFTNPLQIIAKGYRGIFEPLAWCMEKPAGRFSREFSRKVRIVNRSLNGLLRVKAVCNPFRFPKFAWQLISHKLLRWLSPWLLCLHFIAVIAAADHITAKLMLATYGVFAALALSGWWQDRLNRHHPVFYWPYYFSLITAAAAIGVILRLRGTVISTWDTVRINGNSGDRLLLFVPAALVIAVTTTVGVLVSTSGFPSILKHLIAYFLITLILYTYAGYPVVLAACAALHRTTGKSENEFTPEVTLLIIACNEEKVIAEKLKNSLQLDYPAELLEIVVASDGSIDATNSIVKQYAPQGVKLFSFPENRGKAAAINDSMELLKSEIVVFSDANVMYDRQALKKLVHNFHDPAVGVVSGRVALINDSLSYSDSERLYYRIEHFIQEKEGALGTLIGADGAMYAIRRSLFKPLPEETILDDFVISMQIAAQGYRCIHEKEALGFEQNLHELQDEFRRKARIIAGGFQYLLRGPSLPTMAQPLLLFHFVSHKVLRWTSGIIFIPLFLLLINIYATNSPADPFLTSALFCMLTAGLAAGLGQLLPAVRKLRAVNMPHYFLMLVLASLVGLYRELTGGQKATWRGEILKCVE